MTIHIEKNVTRILCIVIVVGFALAVGLFVFALVARVYTGESVVTPLMARTMLGAGFSAYFVAFFLWAWRRCARCSRRLFADAHFLSGLASRTAGSSVLEPPRDYRAKTLLGSYRNAAILNTAIHGRLMCQWCGHEDGATPPDYIITAQ